MKQKKELKDLNLLDRFLFDEAAEDPEIMGLILEIILGKEIMLKQQPQSEKEIRKNLWGKSVRLDVLCTDTDDTVYNAEVQKVNTGALPKRSRYYQGIIDSKLIPVGEIDYNKLNDVYVIMITPFDLFGEGKYKYDFGMMCRNVPGLELSDGSNRLFLNTRGTNAEDASEELIALLKYMEHSSEETALQTGCSKVKQIHQKIEAIKQNEEVGIKYMNAWEEKILDEQNARHDEKVQIAKGLKADGISVTIIAKNTGLSEEEIEAL